MPDPTPSEDTARPVGGLPRRGLRPRLRAWAQAHFSPRDGSLRGRLILLAAVWFVISLALTAILLIQDFSFASTKRFESGMDIILKNLYTDASFDPDGELRRPPQYDPRLSNTYSGLYWEAYELDAHGGVSHRDRSLSLQSHDIKMPRVIDKSGDPVHYDGMGPLGRPLRQVAQYLIFKDRILVFVVAEDSAKLRHDIETFSLITVSALAFLALASLMAIYVQVQFGLRPLYHLTQEISRVQSGQKRRLEGRYPREIRPVAEQLNAFIDHNQEVLERQRTHVGNLAHALKTPLSVLMNEAQDDTPLAHQVVKQVDIMKSHVDRNLRRARAAARALGAGELTQVEPLIDELAVTLEQVFRRRSVEIDWRCAEGLSFLGERQDLQEILGNLMENACIWCRSKVRITAAPEGEGRLTIRVEDDGPGLEADQFANVLKRGARLDESAPGSGLGLSIVDELVRAYKGELVLGRAVMGGLLVCLILPGTTPEPESGG